MMFLSWSRIGVRLPVVLLSLAALTIAACGNDGEDTAVEDERVDEADPTADQVDVNSPFEFDVAAMSYDDLPFAEVLPLEGGEFEIDGEVREIHLGFSQTGFNHPWRVAMLDSMVAEVARFPNVRLTVLDGEVDTLVQSDTVDDLLAGGVDAVIMSPFESDGLVPAANRVMEAGIPLVVLDRDVHTDKSLFIGQSNVELSRALAEVMVDDLGGSGRIVELMGVAGSSAAIDRSAGLQEALAEAPGIEIIAEGDAEFLRDPAVTLMEDWLVRFGEGEIDAVFSHAEESGWGSQIAIGRSDRCGDGIRQYTFDASNAGIQAALDGTFDGDANYSPFIGDVGVRAALMLLRGDEIPGAEPYDQPGERVLLPDLPTVTPENATEVVGLGWGDFEPPPDPCA